MGAGVWSHRKANSLAYRLKVFGSKATALWAACRRDVDDGDARELTALKMAAQTDKRADVVLSSSVDDFLHDVSRG